jgi:hypothetical protein
VSILCWNLLRGEDPIITRSNGPKPINDTDYNIKSVISLLRPSASYDHEVDIKNVQLQVAKKTTYEIDGLSSLIKVHTFRYDQLKFVKDIASASDLWHGIRDPVGPSTGADIKSKCTHCEKTIKCYWRSVVCTSYGSTDAQEISERGLAVQIVSAKTTLEVADTEHRKTYRPGDTNGARVSEVVNHHSVGNLADNQDAEQRSLIARQQRIESNL